MRKMKDSGIDWIGRIPGNWNVKTIDSCFRERNEKVSDYDWEPLSVTKQGIVKQLENAAKSDAHDSRKKVCNGDFVINSRSDRKQSCGLSEYDGSVSLINIVLENKNLKKEYIKYLLKNYGFAEEFYRWGSGIVSDLWSTNYQKMKKISIPIPPLDEQFKIGKELDKKITEIDNVIEKTRQTIEDYKQYKQSIITKAVTKGLNKNVEMKDSGIEWIGRIPKHWSLKKLKFSSKTRNKKYNEQFGNLEYFALENIISGDAEFEKTNNQYSLDGTMICEKDDVVFGKLRPYLAKVYKSPKRQCCSSEFAIFYDFDGISDYYKYLFLTHWFIKLVDASTYGTKMPRVNIEYLNNMMIPIPNIEEQIEIVKYLENKIIEINELIKNKENLIIELEKYKKSLIYEYVTGKKEVI
jgi:type I restriction enzyme S subunit